MMAAELALGLLEGQELADAKRRLLSDRDFAGAVEDWRNRFAALFAGFASVTPPATVETRMDAALAPAPSAPAPANDRGWLAVAASAVIGVALGFAVYAGIRPGPPPVHAPPAPRLIATAITPTTGAPALAAVYDADRGEVRVTRAALAPAGHSAELWVIAGKAPPRSLGLLADTGGTRLGVSAPLRAAMAAGATLAVSIEPRGGSPTGAPTGPVVATGVLSGA